MSILCSVISSNFLEHRFKIQCEVTLPQKLTWFHTNPAEFFLPFHPEGVAVRMTWDKGTVSIKLNSTHWSEKTVFSISIIKVDGSKVELLAPDFSLQLENYSEYVRDSEKLIFRSEISPEALQISQEHMRLKSLYDSIDAEPSDFVIKTHDGSLKVTKNVLVIQWEFFKTLIESKCTECSENIWIVQDFDLEVMRDVVRYVYCGVTSFTEEHRVIDVLKASHRYLLKDLTTSCIQYLIAQLSTKNILQRLVFSDVYDLEELKAGCMKYLPFALSQEYLNKLQGYEEYVQYAKNSILTEACLDDACETLSQVQDKLFQMRVRK